MTIGGALSELNNLLNADDIPFYYKPAIKAIMETISDEKCECERNPYGLMSTVMNDGDVWE